MYVKLSRLISYFISHGYREFCYYWLIKSVRSNICSLQSLISIGWCSSRWTFSSSLSFVMLCFFYLSSDSFFIRCWCDQKREERKKNGLQVVLINEPIRGKNPRREEKEANELGTHTPTNSCVDGISTACRLIVCVIRLFYIHLVLYPFLDIFVNRNKRNDAIIINRILFFIYWIISAENNQTKSKWFFKVDWLIHIYFSIS